MQFSCKLLILTICARRALALNQTQLGDVAAVSDDNDASSYIMENTALATTQNYRPSRWQRHNREGFVATEPRVSHEDYQDEEDSPDHRDAPETKAMSQPKVVDYWNGYYDFLINEGSYKFWAVFQLATAALLIYSGFAALYYAKINPQISEDYPDDFLRRRRRYADWDGPPADRPFFGFQPEIFQRIIDAIAEDVH
ncbi:uncharacterized protein LOC131671342 [Phymastichus coffea]|uniref:uncharacterized protein LOC131671342 n=1 Tax=Phymastichus coffea TaxID=108790 RepID=UPI00273CCF26|nr:uncharacterized protein LOC131671342 [Phymastichus coffea]